MPELIPEAEHYTTRTSRRNEQECRVFNKAIRALENIIGMGLSRDEINEIQSSDHGKAINIKMNRTPGFGRRFFAAFANEGLICIAFRFQRMSDELQVFFAEALVNVENSNITSEITWSADLVNYGGSDGWGY